MFCQGRQGDEKKAKHKKTKNKKQLSGDVNSDWLHTNTQVRSISNHLQKHHIPEVISACIYSIVHYIHSQIHIWKQKWFRPILFDFKPTMTMHQLMLLEMSEFIKRYMDGLSHVYSDAHLYIQTLMVGHHYDTRTCTCRRHCAHVIIETWPSTHFTADKSDSVNSCDYTSTG